MANEVELKLTSDASQLNQTMDQSTQKVEQFSKATEDAKDSIKDMGKQGAMSTKELLKEIGKMTGTEKNFTGYKRQLSQITKEITDLTVNYRMMNDEMKNSDVGKAALQRIQELTVKASEYKDAIMDSQNAVKNLASDTAIWDGVAQGIDAASSALQSFAAAGILSEDSEKGLVKILAQMKGAQAACNTVIKVGNLLQKDSKVMTAISIVQSKALAKAKELEAASTGKATLAQKAFNLVAKSNPYLLIISAIVAATAAIGAWTLATRKHNSETEKAKRIQEGYNKAIKDGKIQAGDSIAKFQLLRTQYMNLRTEGEKTEWIKNNKDKFSELGVELNNIADAQKWLVDNAADFIKALTLEAEAAALMSYYQEEYKKGIEESLKAQEKVANKKAGRLSRKDIEKYGLIEGTDYTKTTISGTTSPTGITTPPTYLYEWTSSGLEKMKKAGGEAGEAVLEGYTEKLSPAATMAATKLAQAEELRRKSTPTPTTTDDSNKGGKGGESKEDRYRKEQEEWLKRLKDAQMQLMQLKIQSLSVDKNDAAAVEASTKAIEEQEKAVDDIKKNIDNKSQIINSELQLLKDYKGELDKQLPTLVDQSEEWYRQIDIINEVEKQIKELEGAADAYKKRINTPELKLELPQNTIKMPENKVVQMKVDPEVKWDKMVEAYKEAGDRLSKIKDWLDVGAISRTQAESLVAELNAELQKKGIKVPLTLDTDSIDIKTQFDVLKEDIESFDKWGSVANNIVGSFNSIYDSVKNLGDALDEADNAWEGFFAIFQTGMTIFQGFTSIVEGITTAMELMNAVKAANIPLIQQETSQLRQNTNEQISNAAAKGTSAAMGAGESVSGTPLVGPVLAAAAILSILGILAGAISSAKGYATGGIIGGNNHNDGILARLSSGEMVLNDRQQANLWNQINNPTARQNESYSTGGNVEFRIKGTELVGVLQNINKRNSKL